MSIEVKCAKCGRRYVLPDSKAGERVRCSDCRRAFLVPDTGVLPFEALAAGGGGGKVRKVTLILAGFLLVAGATWAILSAIVGPAVERARFDAWQTARGRIIERIAHAMTAYAAENGDCMPYDAAGPLESLALLYPEYVKVTSAFWYPPGGPAALLEPKVFPRGCALAGAYCTYVYHPNEAVAPTDPEQVVLEEILPPNTPRGRFVIQADGRVRAVGGK